MHNSLIVTCLVAGATLAAAALTAPALAQSPIDGPLAAPGAVTAKPEATPQHAKAKPKKVRHAAARPAGVSQPRSRPADAAAQPAYATPTAISAPRRESPDNPLSLGMKWQGNNDTAAETRSQNLDGHAFGTGAEVGMKLHF